MLSGGQLIILLHTVERLRGFWSYRQIRVCAYVMHRAVPVCVWSSSMLQSTLCIRMH